METRSEKLFFVNDYCETAHPEILKRISETAGEKNPGYGLDGWCASAAGKIRAACDCPRAEVYFFAGGTQTNQVVIDTLLRPFEGVVSADSGHVGVHEAGAIEYTGHKVLTLPGSRDASGAPEGKLRATGLKAFLEGFYADGNHEHMVFPGMVYISHPTEYGTLYTTKELKELREVCAGFEIPLYLDGARLAYALACAEEDPGLPTLPDIARLTDVFYIGGTKCGAMFGEAAVFTKGNMPFRFATRVKQHGAMLAKGWLTGVQFDALFSDGLYCELGANAIRTAKRLRAAMKEKGYRFLVESPTNQLIVVLENRKMKKLAEKVEFSFWEKIDETHTAVRFCTSWGTGDGEVDRLIDIL